MESYVIYLKCYEASGYFTGIQTTSITKEVGVHPYLARAYKFKNKNEAWETAKSLKRNFKCIITYEVKVIN